jgi:hypothetical protein
MRTMSVAPQPGTRAPLTRFATQSFLRDKGGIALEPGWQLTPQIGHEA